MCRRGLGLKGLSNYLWHDDRTATPPAGWRRGRHPGNRFHARQPYNRRGTRDRGPGFLGCSDGDSQDFPSKLGNTRESTPILAYGAPALACVGTIGFVFSELAMIGCWPRFRQAYPLRPQISPDNSALATLDTNGRLAFGELPSGQTRWEKALCERSDPLQGEWVLRFSADNGRLVACGRDYCEISDPKSGRRQSRFDGKSALSPDGGKLALARSDSLCIYNVATGQLEATHVLGEEFKETA